MKIKIGDVIKSINPNAEYTVVGNNLPINECKIEWHNGTQPIPANEILAKQQELQAIEDVISKRIKEYGSIAEQIEYITENGLDAWQSKVNSIKAKYPKE